MADISKMTDAELLALANAPTAPGGIAQMSNEQLRAAAGIAPVSVGEDIAKSAGTGVVKGGAALAGATGDIRDIVSGAYKYLMGQAGISPETTAKVGETFRKGFESTPVGKAMAIAPTSKQTMDVVNKAAQGFGGLHEPQTTWGEYAQTAGELLPGALIPGGNIGLARRGLQYVVAPALASEALGQYTKGETIEPWARAAGAVLAPSVAGRAITPFGMSAERQAMAKILAGEGVTALTAGQKTGAGRLRWMESSFGGGPAAERQSKAGEQLTQAAMRKTGSAEPLATPEAVEANARRLSGDYSNVLSRITVRPDAQLGNDLGATANQYAKGLPTEHRTIVGNYISDIVQEFQRHGGNVPGDVYKRWRSGIDAAYKSYKGGRGADAQTAESLRGVRNALDGAMRRSAAPEDVAFLKNLDRQYVAQKAVEKAMQTAPGEQAAFGYLTPAQIRGAARSGGGSFYAKGQGMFAPLARASTALMTPLPSSGTAERVIPALFAAIGATGGHALGGGGPFDILLGAATSSAIPALAGRVLMNPATQGYLGNSLIAQEKLKTELARALMATNPKLQEVAGNPALQPPQ